MTESACPNVNRSVSPDPEFTKPISYTCEDGSEYVFYDHDDGYGNVSRVQFCKLIGRKRDVFQCLNVSEWTDCPHYRNTLTKKEG